MEIVRVVPESYGQASAEGQNQSEKKEIETDSGFLGKEFYLALDIGTTTVEMALYLQDDISPISVLREKNAQTLMGADVMMRLMHCQNGLQDRLKKLIQKQVLEMAEALCQGSCSVSEVKKISVVGNTAMCHIFLGMDTSGLAGSPFRAAYSGAYRCRGDEIGLSEFGETEIYVLPGIGAHVGADAVAMAAESGIGERVSGRARLAIDIGTNAELVLEYQGQMISCSAAAGPAFEGASISHGMRGEAGAITGFKIAAGTGNIILDVIDGSNAKKVCGICGSGLIDIISELLQHGLLRPDGYLLQKREAEDEGLPGYLTERLGEDVFCVYQDIVLTREDIRQFQLAKAAVQTGIILLLDAAHCSLSELDEIILAGTFGKHISKKNAVRLGLIPDIGTEKIKSVGNAALTGAGEALFSENFRKKAERLAGQARHIELADHPDFQQIYLSSMELKTNYH